jgi:hypothetical protein
MDGGPDAAAVKILDQYVTTAPSPQNALDIFRGEWTSRLPDPLSSCTAGTLGLFDDPRIHWFREEAGGFDGKSALELGPLEAGHTWMLERGGARSIVAVEGNVRAYLKCLTIKELLGLTTPRFLCGDFVEYLRGPGPSFDLCVASGVLYHMRNPAELIALLAARCTQHVFLWTHYYDEPVIGSTLALSAKFSGSSQAEHQGFEHALFHYEYQAALDWSGFCGGSAPSSRWMTRADILRCLDHFGFCDIRTGHEQPDHPNGPSFAVVARKR